MAGKIWPNVPGAPVLIDNGGGYTTLLSAPANRITGVQIPTWASKIYVDYELRVGVGIPWYFYLLPDGLTTNMTSLATPSFAGTATEAVSFPLVFTLNAAREAGHGRCQLDVGETLDAKYFESKSAAKLNTGAIIDRYGWTGILDRVARVTTIDIIGATSAGEIANALDAGSWLKVWAQ